MRVQIFTVFAALVLCTESARLPRDLTAPAKTFRDGANNFGLKLFKEVSGENPGNLIMSPFSVDAVLALLLEGARGTSAKELQTALGLSDDIQETRSGYNSVINTIRDNNSTNTLELQNRLFEDVDFKPLMEYSNNLRSFYKAEVQVVDYSNPKIASAAINKWASDSTHGRITKVVDEDSLDPSTALVLANAVYFKGIWKTPFNKNLTTKEPFYPSNEKSITVDMMHLTDQFNYADLADLNCQALELPYDNDKFSMLILLPRKGFTVDELLKKKFSVPDILSKMRSSKVAVSLPRHKINNMLDLNSPLQKVGIQKVFSGDADLSGISGSKNLAVSKVIQVAEIEVNEEGTVASAVTAGFVGGYSAAFNPQRLFVFNANQPFLSFITEQMTRTVLFEASVIQPSED